MDKRKFAAATRGFEVKSTRVGEDGELYFVLAREDGKGGMEFIGNDGYDKTRNTTKFPDIAYIKVPIPKDYRLTDDSPFEPTPSMMKFAEKLFENYGDEKKAIKDTGINTATFYKWKKNDSFKDWLNMTIKDSSRTHYAKLMSQAIKKAEDNPQMAKFLIEELGVKHDTSDVPNMGIVEFSGDWENLEEKYGLQRPIS